ncbi:uncharacterized protein BX663DRAFT_523237 [Cokeromyces recurvatus]|uniref:uncharacterized protein n=1 Tax=Cokeromyces recurvatus TaxID=90255 RepID=UPI0022204946|nr:uncharacterized protein BX663DRAFT_523237 [Cokeromyces recurvatus]KAI7898917.1 hypothetical protein BX663DRAFT_523237 [Cokeromyces recurvatus]
MISDTTTLNYFEHELEQKLMYMYQYDVQQSYDDEGMIVAQHLSSEQYDYEFPKKSRLNGLAYLDFDDSFFDLFSFQEILSEDDHMYKEGACYNESVPIMDTDNSSSGSSSSIHTTESRIILIKLNKSSLTYLASDERYEDESCEELKSDCIFYPIYNHDDIRHQAATKIQALWRGYRERCNQPCYKQQSKMSIHLVNLFNQLDRRRQDDVQHKLEQLERQVCEERAMRVAFEKAMEDMTVLIDQQQKSLFDRLVEQETEIRKRLETALEPLDKKLRKEMHARLKLEEMMSRVLDQLHMSETLREAKEEEIKSISIKLEKAVDDITLLKKKQQTMTTKNPKIQTSMTHSLHQPSPQRMSSITINRKNVTTDIGHRHQQQQQRNTNKPVKHTNFINNKTIERLSAPVSSNRRLPITKITSQQVTPSVKRKTATISNSRK